MATTDTIKIEVVMLFDDNMWETTHVNVPADTFNKWDDYDSGYLGWLWTTPEGNNFRATWRKGCIVSYFWSYDSE